MLIKSENVKAERKKLFRLVKQSKRGKLPKSKVDESYAAWRNHASKGNCFTASAEWMHITNRFGDNTLTVDTELQPSSMTITYFEEV